MEKGKRRKKEKHNYKRSELRNGKKGPGKEDRRICERTTRSRGKGGTSKDNSKGKNNTGKNKGARR